MTPPVIEASHSMLKGLVFICRSILHVALITVVEYARFLCCLNLARKSTVVYLKLEAQWAEPVSLTFHSALRKLYIEPSMVFPTKFQFIWLLGFREYFLKITPPKIAYGGHVC